MTHGHSDEHEAILLRVLVGDIDEKSAPEARATFASCSVCRRRLEELRATSRALDEAARDEERSVLDAAARLAADPAEAPLVRPTIERLAAPRPISRAGRLGLVVGGVAAAILLIVFAISRSGDDDGGSDTPRVLGSDGITDLRPAGPVRAFDAFTWTYALPPGGWFEIAVYDDVTGTEEPLVRESRLREARWTPSPDQQALLPARIRWEVKARDATQTRPIATGSASASRSSSH